MVSTRMLGLAAALLLATAARAQIGPGEFDPSAGDAPSIGETSEEMDFPSAGDAPSIGGANEPFGGQPDEGAP